MLKHIAAIRIDDAPDLRVSASIGMATQSAETLNGEALLKLADLAVYQAKESGKNCLRFHADEQFHYSANES
ncbi:diguanylate cyclase [Mariprofundus ferrooxydans]|nr:diguanylate cyclase [Mariprofundus ferrooxydans]